MGCCGGNGWGDLRLGCGGGIGPGVWWWLGEGRGYCCEWIVIQPPLEDGGGRHGLEGGVVVPRPRQSLIKL